MDPSFYEQLGRRIATLRRARFVTQETLAERASIGNSYLARIEAGNRKPTLDVLHGIAGALGVPIGRLLVDENAGTIPRWRTAAAAALVELANDLPEEDLRLLIQAAEHLRRLRGHIPYPPISGERDGGGAPGRTARDRARRRPPSRSKKTS